MGALPVAVRKLQEETALRHDSLTWFEPGEDFDLIVLLRADGDEALTELPRLGFHVNERLVFCGAQDRGYRYHQNVLLGSGVNNGLDECVLLQQAMWIGSYDAHRRGASGGIQHRANIGNLAMEDFGNGSVG